MVLNAVEKWIPPPATMLKDCSRVRKAAINAVLEAAKVWLCALIVAIEPDGDAFTTY